MSKKISNNLSANVAQTQTMAEMPNKTFSNTWSNDVAQTTYMAEMLYKVA